MNQSAIIGYNEKRNHQLGILLLPGNIACGDAGIGFNITRKVALLIVDTSYTLPKYNMLLFGVV